MLLRDINRNGSGSGRGRGRGRSEYLTLEVGKMI